MTPSSALLADFGAKQETTRQVRVAPGRPDPAGTDLCDGTKWRQFVHSLSNDDSLSVVRGMLARSGFMSADKTTITVGFYSSVTHDKVQTEIDDDAFRSALTGTFGEGVQLSTVLDTDGQSGRSLAEEIDRIKAEKTEELRRQTLSAPAVAATQEVFPGAAVIGEPRIPAIEEIADVR